VDVQRVDKLVGPTALYLLAVADSGERKTTVDTFFTKTIRDWEAEQEKLAEPDLQANRAANEAWEAEKTGVVNAIREASKRGKDTDQLKEKLVVMEAQEPKKPMVPRLLVGDATSEALTYRLAHVWPVGGMLSAEAGIVFGGHAMGRDSIMRNLATLNTLWDGIPLNVERRTSESYSVRSARLSLGLAVQPETVRQFIDGTRGLARGSGFMARFLIAWPESTQGGRMFQEAAEQWPALAQFRRRLADLLDLPVQLDDFGQLAMQTLSLSQVAKSVWMEFHDNVEAELAPNGEMAETRDVASKAGDNAARMAALFHVFEHGPSGEIGIEHIRTAARVITWHLFEARRFLNQLETPAEISNAMLLESWLLDYCRQNRVSGIPISQIQRLGPNRTRRKQNLDAALFELEAAGRVRKSTTGRKVTIEINPILLGGCNGTARLVD
jgi:putative DNA primase/helicase